MKIIEEFICGKQKEACEDGLFYNDDFIVVIDGVTSKGKKKWDGKTSGEYAKDIIISQFSTINKDVTAEELITRLNKSLYDSYKNCIKKDEIIEYLRACIIIYSKYYNEIWSFGDCQCKINSNSYQATKKIDILNSEMRSLALEYYLNNGFTINDMKNEDLGRKLILPFLKMQLYFENKKSKFGYSVLNGQKINLKHIKKYKLKAGDVVILATDGYPKLLENLEETENYLQEILQKDPLCYKENKSTKGLKEGNVSFDDRCFIKFKVL